MNNSQPNRQELADIFTALKKYNMRDTERALRKEIEKAINKNRSQKNQIEPKIDLHTFIRQYTRFCKAIDNVTSEIKYTLNIIKSMIFIIQYIKLPKQNVTAKGIEFFKKLAGSLEFYFQSAMEEYIADPSSQSLKLDSIKDKIILFCSRKCQNWLKDFCEENNFEAFEDFLELHFIFKESQKDQHDYPLAIYQPRDFAKSFINNLNKSQILLGVPDETFFTSLQNEILNPSTTQPDSPVDEKRRGRKKSVKKESTNKVTIPNDCPDWSRIPLPNILDSPLLRANKLLSIEKSTGAPTLGKDIQPSICGYTIFNTTNNSLPCAKFSENSEILATGFENSTITIWNLSNREDSGLRTLRNDIDPQSIDFSIDYSELEEIIYEEAKSFTKDLIGHSNTVSSLDFNYDNSLLISASFDESLRLWSLNTWSTLSVYKGHLSPVWDVSFAPFGQYFVSCGSDRVSRLWSLEQSKPLRLFCGHSSDVSKVKFHPNSNYILTGSDDCNLLLWDIMSGNYERCFIGHTSPISAIDISPDGKKCASGDISGLVIIWDMYSGQSLGKINLGQQLRNKKSDECISSIKFGKDSKSIAIGSLKSKILVGNVANLDNHSITTNSDSFETIGVYRTKNTPITELHFTYNNMLLSLGAFTG